MYNLYVTCKNCGQRICIKTMGCSRQDAEIELINAYQERVLDRHPDSYSIDTAYLLGHCSDGCLRTYIYSPFEIYAAPQAEPRH